MDEKPKLLENFEIFWWKFYWKIEFFIFFENLLLKIELSEITPFFYNNFFGFGGGGISPLSPPPWLRPCIPPIISILELTHEANISIESCLSGHVILLLLLKCRISNQHCRCARKEHTQSLWVQGHSRWASLRIACISRHIAEFFGQEPSLPFCFEEWP